MNKVSPTSIGQAESILLKCKTQPSRSRRSFSALLRNISVWTLTALVSLGSPEDSFAQSYAFSVLDTLGSTQAQAYAINSTGQVAGFSNVGTGSITHATLWNGSAASDLGMTASGFTNSQGRGINNAGQVTGFGYYSGGTVGHALVWNGSNVTDLGTLGGSFSAGNAINGAGMVAGSSYLAGDTASHATLWSGATASDLGTLGGSNSTATAINANGLVVGYSDRSAGFAHATLWSGSSKVDLNTWLGGNSSQSRAADINDLGMIVGWTLPASTFSRRATLWNAGTVTELAAPSDAFQTEANAINNGGSIVGRTFAATGSYATLWNGFGVVNLNSFLDTAVQDAGWELLSAVDINDNGAITGLAYNSRSGVQTGFVLTVVAVPEPAAGLLVIAGFGTVAGWRRTRAKQYRYSR